MVQLALFSEGSPQQRNSDLASAEDSKISENEDQSFEEKRVESIAMRPARRPARQPRAATLDAKALPAAWPAALTWSEALTYSRLSASQLRRWQKAGALPFRRAGPHGSKIVLRSTLDQLLEGMFEGPASDISEDFDFG